MALEAIRGKLTTSQLVATHGVRQTLVNAWKEQAIERKAGMFAGKMETAEASHKGEVQIPTEHSQCSDAKAANVPIASWPPSNQDNQTASSESASLRAFTAQLSFLLRGCIVGSDISLPTTVIFASPGTHSMFTAILFGNALKVFP